MITVTLQIGVMDEPAAREAYLRLDELLVTLKNEVEARTHPWSADIVSIWVQTKQGVTA